MNGQLCVPKYIITWLFGIWIYGSFCILDGAHVKWHQIKFDLHSHYISVSYSQIFDLGPGKRIHLLFVSIFRLADQWTNGFAWDQPQYYTNKTMQLCLIPKQASQMLLQMNMLLFYIWNTQYTQFWS